jgi:transcriptional regulator
MERMSYEADKGIRRSHYYDQGGLTAAQQDELITRLHQRGWSQSRIGRELGLTQQGISKALRRIAAGRVGAGPRG